MIAIRTISVVAVVSMVAAISYGFLTGSFFDDGSAIWALPWGRVTLIDLYVGLAIFALWVAIREARMSIKFFWWVGLVVLGNLAAAIYLMLASFSSANYRELLLGKHRPFGTDS